MNVASILPFAKHLVRLARAALPAAVRAALPAVVLVAGPALATDGGSAQEGETYYEEQMGGTSTEGFTDLAAPLPTQLHAVESAAQVRYRPSDAAPDAWEVRIEGFARRHERVDAVYDMVLVLPLPENAWGGDAFRALDRGVVLREGSPQNAVSLVYGGEKLLLKRNVALEKTWIPSLVGPESGRLPSLAGTGYRYTAWDAIVTRDPQHADTVQGWARLRYAAPAGTPAPEADDPRLAAWWITWIPSLRADVPPYAVRMDVVPASP